MDLIINPGQRLTACGKKSWGCISTHFSNLLTSLHLTLGVKSVAVFVYMSIFVSKQILWAPGDCNTGVCWPHISLSPWDSYRITPWTRRKVWSNIAHLLQRFLMHFYQQGPPHKELEQPSCAGDRKCCVVLLLWLVNTACQSRQFDLVTSFLGLHAVSKALILLFLLFLYLGLHSCHLPLKRVNDVLSPPNALIVSFQIKCIGIWLTYSKMALFVILVYSSTHFEKCIPRWVPPNKDIRATSLSFFIQIVPVYTICIKQWVIFSHVFLMYFDFMNPHYPLPPSTHLFLLNPTIPSTSMSFIP